MSPGDRSFPAAVLWDFDGTLADTEPLWIAAEFEVIEGELGPVRGVVLTLPARGRAKGGLFRR